MSQPIFLRRVVLRNYKSIGNCDVRLGPLTYLVGANGSGKSNFIDALHFVRDALTGSLDNALNERGGLSEVRRRSSGHPNHFGIRLPRDAKGWLRARMAGGSYGVMTDQPAFSARFDLRQAFDGSRSFRKLCKEWDRQTRAA
jgi:ABC-type multidrug transport system ATPase subunit